MNRGNCYPTTVKDKGIIPSSAGSKLIPRDHGKLSENITSATRKEKRRKTKKERNSIKFKTHQETFQKKGWLQDYLRRHDGFSKSHVPKTAHSSSGKQTFTSKQVFITEDRLTQHQGIFDHEVKSINIERFARETTEGESAKTNDGSSTNQPERTTPEGHMELILDLIQTPKVKDQEELWPNQKSSEKLDSRVAETGEMNPLVPQPDLCSNQKSSKKLDPRVAETGEMNPLVPQPDLCSDQKSSKKLDPRVANMGGMGNLVPQHDLPSDQKSSEKLDAGIAKMGRIDTLVPQRDLRSDQKSSEKLDPGVANMGGMDTLVSQPDPSSQPEISIFCIQGSGSHLQNTLSGSQIGAFPEDMQEAPIHEAAQSINKVLGLLNLFPGRNLVSEIRQSIMEKMKELPTTSSNLSDLPAQRNLDYIWQADSSTKCLWEHAREGGAVVRKPSWVSQGHMQSTPVCFMPLPSDTPSHRHIKMVRQDGGQQILNPALYQPVRSESGYEPSLQHRLLLAENPSHLFPIQLESEDIRPSKQDRDTLTYHRKNTHTSKHNLSVNTDSPQVRWTLAHDDVGHAHNTHQKNFKRHANQRMINQGWLPGQPLPPDVSCEKTNTLEPRVGPSSSRGHQPSFNVLHDNFTRSIQNTPISKVYGVPPLEFSSCYAGISSPQSNYINPFESHYNMFHDHGTEANRFQLENPLGLRNIGQHISSKLDTDMDSPHNFFRNSSSQKWRNINVSSEFTTWSPTSSLKEVNSLVANPETGWQTWDSWKHRISDQGNLYGKRPIAMPPTSSAQETAFVGLSNVRSQPNKPTHNLSPETWVYPRMRLY